MVCQTLSLRSKKWEKGTDSVTTVEPVASLGFPGGASGQKSLADHSPWGHKEPDTACDLASVASLIGQLLLGSDRFEFFYIFIHYIRSFFKIYFLFLFFFSFFPPYIFISWRLITLQSCSGFCHTLT